MFKNLLLWPSLAFLRIVRWIINADSRTYAGLHFGWIQSHLERIGRWKAAAVSRKASLHCPAYAQFLKEQHASGDAWEQIPITTKENYVKKFTIEERCYGGQIPNRGVVIDESSGSSGLPNNWVRGPEERMDVKKILNLSYELLYKDKKLFLLNCFALGPWATGMNVSMSLVDVGILKSIGPDQAKLEHTLELFGPSYNYLVMGYPPFIKGFVDSTKLDLSRYDLRLIVGGEGISEGLRQYLSKTFKSIHSSYGASDLEINLGIETDMTVALRKVCWEKPALSKALFEREQPPMIFQYNPLDYLIEQTPQGELIYTINRLACAAPKIRYNLRDMGGTYAYRDVSRRLKDQGVSIKSLAPRQSCFPVLFVYGRSDLTVPFYGSKVFPTDVELLINEDPVLIRAINSFQLKSYEDAQVNHHLRISLERTNGSKEALDPLALRDRFFEGLKRVNQDFREVSRLFNKEQLEVELWEYEKGPFASRDIRVKSKYIA